MSEGNIHVRVMDNGITLHIIFPPLTVCSAYLAWMSSSPIPRKARDGEALESTAAAIEAATPIACLRLTVTSGVCRRIIWGINGIVRLRR